VSGILPEMQEEFFSIFDPRFRRLPKEVILPQLPPIVYETRHVTMNPKQKKAYESMATTLVATLDDGSLAIAKNPIAQLTRLTQFASAYIEVNEDGNLRLSDPSCKLDQLIEDLEDYNEPVVVFAQSRQLIEMASKRLEKTKILHSVVKGGQSNDTRQNEIDSFQNGRVSVILVVIAAGGVGITLTRGRIAIFLQRSWSNVDQQQAIGRLHRIGSEVHDSVVIIDYVTQGTVEEGQLAVLAGKADLLEEVVRDVTTIRKLLNGEVF
jgi:SNF2 family DNA or RNA helicase